MLLNECKECCVVEIQILDDWQGFWKKRSVFMNVDDATFSKACAKYIFKPNEKFYATHREVLLVE